MTLLYASPVFLEHETGSHPETPKRLYHIAQRLSQQQLDVQCERPEIQPITNERLAYVHSLDYAADVAEFARRGGGYIEADTAVCPRSYDVALRAAGAVADAVQRVVRGPDPRALCLVRPPGHHALPASAMGFCLFNNIAIGARVAIKELNLDRVLIIDWDVHHGNGTQDSFWTDPQVAFFSIHRFPFYPGTGAADETGGGEAAGTKLNLPVKYGTPRQEYLARFKNQLEAFADKFKPQLLLISAGFDAHRLDPIGSLGLEEEDFVAMTQVVMSIAKTHCQGRLVSVLEGGYHLEMLPACVEVHLRELIRGG